MKTIANRLAQLVDAYHRCVETNNTEWIQKHKWSIEELCKNNLPSGSGIDSGTKIDLDASNRNKLVLLTAFHHMSESGMYDGWTEHKIIVAPDLLSGVSLRITGRDRNQIKEYLYEVFHNDLMAVPDDSTMQDAKAFVQNCRYTTRCV